MANLEPTSLNELQKFLIDELSPTDNQVSMERAFTPITTGLGLESPHRTSPPVPPTPATKKIIPRTPPVVSPKTPPPMPISTLTTPQPTAVTSPPPPLPNASAFRRFFATFLDQVFVLGIWLGSILITFRTQNQQGFWSLEALQQILLTPSYRRWLILEFGAIWFCYYALCLGMLNMSFGMWVWGLRVAYGTQLSVVKRLSRVIFSTLFFAPIIPSLFLIPRIHGKNLLDWLTGSRVYRTV